MKRHLLQIAFAVLAGLSAASAQKAAAPSAGDAEKGRQLYLKIGCWECHGRQAQGGGYTGPRLAPDPTPIEGLIWYVRQPTGDMPPYTAKVVSDQELGDIYAFLRSVPRPPAAKTIPILK
ncbi:MAG: cytochrome c [Candidatus Solibacter sp.]|nr:cytochrome c [Candidatus Solibacter sp.]